MSIHEQIHGIHIDPSFYSCVGDHVSEGVFFVNTHRIILYWNPEAEHLTGYRADEMVGAPCHHRNLVHVDQQFENSCTEQCPLLEALSTEQVVSKRLYLRHKNGYRLPVNLKAIPVKDSNGHLIGAIEIFSDASSYIDVSSLNRRLQKVVRIDPLTKLANRQAMNESINQELLRLKRYNAPFTTLLADIDHFKGINAQFGHPAGDKVLLWIASKLKAGLRKVDTAGRYGGNTFLIILPSSNIEIGEMAAEKLRRDIDKHPCPAIDKTVTVSIGATNALATDTLDTLIDRTSQALTQAKKQGRNCTRIL